MHRFEAILSNPQGSDVPWDRVLDESPSFVAFPSIGALVPGWMLIVPRRPMLNLSRLTSAEAAELCQFARVVARRIATFGGQPYYFEHGNHTRGGLVGCGVDQAHLHVVPLPFDLMSAALEASDDKIAWGAVSNVGCFTELTSATGEYVGVFDPATGNGLAGGMLQPQSQWLRKVIAQKIGERDAWNYNTHPNVPNLLRTVESYTSQ